jgi:HK97 family phage prohead protease
MKRAARTSDHSSHPPMFAAPRGAAFLFSEPDACTFIRTDRRFRFCATNNDRCRWHRRGLCPPVRRDRSGARHGHARRLCRHARGGGLRRIPMLCQHDPSEPVGIWLELREDHRGLFAHGRLIPDVRRGRELLSLLRAGAIDGLSIGFRTAKARIDPRTRIRRIYAVDLWEISIVTFPMLTGARVRSVKRVPRASSRIGGPTARRAITGSPGTRSLP